MTEKGTRPNQATDLRREAEEIIHERAALSPGKMANWLDASPKGVQLIQDLPTMLHEMQIHQIELEMQNTTLCQRQEELDAARAKYFDFYELAPVGYITVSKQGLIIEANLTAATMLGMARGVPGLAHPIFSQFIHIEDQDIYYRFRKQLLETGNTQACELRIVKKDSPVFWAHMVATAAQNTDGAPVCRVVISDVSEHKSLEDELLTARNELKQKVLDRTQDLVSVDASLRTEILHRKKSKIALHESEERYRILFSRAINGMCIMSTEGKLLEVNESFAKMHGYSIREMLQMEITDLDTPQTSQLAPERIKRILAEKTLTCELEHYHKDGHIFPLEVSASLISAGEVSCIQCSYQDITDRKQAEQTLRKQQAELALRSRLAAVGEFAASIAHEVNQPLGAIMNNARAAQHFLSSATPVIKEAHDALQDIFNDSQRASEVILNLRSFLKMREADLVMIDINTVITEVFSILHHEIGDRHVSTTLELSPDMPQVEGNHTELQQVIMNLILNGCDAMVEVDHQRRHLFIRTAVDELNGIVVAVQDSGTGLNTNEIDRVFDPYYTTKREGLGIGLSISKSILAAHGGRIWAANNPEGGATFYFTLPIYGEKVP